MAEQDKMTREDSHVRRPSELSGNENTRRLGDSVRNDNLLDLLPKVLLDGGAEVGELGDVLLPRGLLLVGLLELEPLLGDADELEALELLELGDGVLVDRVDEEEDLKALLLEDLEERRVPDGGERLASKVVDRLLDLGLSGDVVWVGGKEEGAKEKMREGKS
jgi:hypothetical protein